MTVIADQLMSELLRSHAPKGGAANDLLREFFRGYPVENLHLLLSSSNQAAQSSGAFIAAELGAPAVVVLDDLLRLATHAQAAVRCDVIGAVAAMRELATPEAVAMAVQGMMDEDESVRWKAVRFLSFVDSSLLRTATPHVSDKGLLSAINWLNSVDDSESRVIEIVDRLTGSDRLARIAALVAAIRIHTRSLDSLNAAASSNDKEIREMAVEYLAELKDRGRHRRANER